MATKLKLLLVDQDTPMYKIAMKVGISETRLSRLSTGFFKPKPEERRALSEMLNVSADVLFPNEEGRN